MIKYREIAGAKCPNDNKIGILNESKVEQKSLAICQAFDFILKVRFYMLFGILRLFQLRLLRLVLFL